MSKVDGRVLPALDTFPGLVLTLTALSGELPAALVSRLPAADTYKEYAVKQLKRDNLLRTFYRNGVRGLRLTAAAKHLLLECWPDHLDGLFPQLFHFSGAVVSGPVKGSQAIGRRGAEQRRLFPGQDGHIRIEHRHQHLGHPVQAEAAGDFRFELIGLGTAGEIGQELIRPALQQQMFCGGGQTQAADAIAVFGIDMGQMPPLMGVGEDKRHNYFVLDGGFEQFYYLTNDHCGEVILQLLCHPGEKAILDGILSQGFGPPRPGWARRPDVWRPPGSQSRTASLACPFSPKRR